MFLRIINVKVGRRLNVTNKFKIESPYSIRLATFCFVGRGREPLDAMSLRYANTSLTDLLGRLSLSYAAMGMRNTSKVPVYYRRFFWTCVLSLNKRCSYKFFDLLALQVSQKMKSALL